MALNLTNLFTALGRCGRNAYIIESAQDQQSTPLDDLIGLSFINPSWVASLTQTYDSLIRIEPSGMPTWASIAQAIVQGLCAQESPAYAVDLGTSLVFIKEQMLEQSASVKVCTITSSITADTLNIGTPVVYVTTTRYDGLILQNTIAEVGSMVFTDDAYTGSATRNQEPWQWSGAPNVSSLGTGVPVGTWDWDWPQGSSSSATGSNIDGAQEATTTGNYLTNGAFEDWTGTSPAVLDSWYLSGGTWGTDIRRTVSATAGIDGGYCVEFIAGTSTTEYISQQFNSTETDGTDPTAGTSAALTPFKTYIFNVFLKAAGVVAGGVLTVSLVDSTGTVIQDQAGNNQTQTIALTAHSTSWVAHTLEFRLPTVLPTNGIIRLRIAMTTALTGANLFMDYAAFAQPTQLYAGGPYLISFANPAAPVEAGPNPDGWSVEFTNDRGGAVFGATFQTLVSRLFQFPDLILPYAAVPTISDGLITSGQTFTPNVFQVWKPTDIQSSDTSNPAIDCNAFPYTLQFIQAIGATFTDITSLDTILEESTTGVGAWTSVSGGAFTSVTAADSIEVITITRTKRYIRANTTIVPSGGSPNTYISVTGGY